MTELKIIIDGQGTAKDPNPLGEIKPNKSNYMIKHKESGKVILNDEVFNADTKKWEEADAQLKRYIITEDLFKSGVIFTNISALKFHIGDKRKAILLEENKIRILLDEWK